MPLVLDGTNGISGVDGTVSNPALEGTDNNTGIFFPAADTIAFATGGTEDMRIDSNGRVTLQASSNGALVALTSSANTISMNLNLANNFTHTTTENTTLANPTNITAGQYGVIVVTQGATPMTMAFGSFWDFSNGGVPSLTATASAVDVLSFYVASSTKIITNFLPDVK